MKEDFVDALRRMNRTSEELRMMMNLDDPTRLRRTPSLRRYIRRMQKDFEDKISKN